MSWVGNIFSRRFSGLFRISAANLDTDLTLLYKSSCSDSSELSSFASLAGP